jgi:3-hydroxyacyl-CoA dehydrogenase/enoyl-CoA hydratase/3-hydroxybutyryl-CoA epimerase
MADFTLDIDKDGIAVIAWDVPEKTMNTLRAAGFAELSAHVDTVLSDDKIKGAVITSAKPDFAGGADLNELGAMKSSSDGKDAAQKIFDAVMDGHRTLRKIERGGMDPKTNKGGKPIVAALPGTAAGAGMELAMACHRVFVSDKESAKYGLPETLVGVFPGGGGTVRMLFKTGMMNAMQQLPTGKMLGGEAAVKAGYADEVVPAGELLDRAKAWVKEAKEDDIVKPWDQKGYKMPGGNANHPAGFLTFVGSAAMLHHNTHGVYPAPKAMLSVLYEASLVDFDTALEIEARWFTSVILNPSSEAMIRSLFVNKQALEKGANRPKDVPDLSVKKLGVLGAGLMGAGIAHVSAKAGIEVVLLDQDMKAAEKGKAHSAEVMDKAIARRRSTEEKKEALLAKITPTSNHDDLKDCDLIVEAVFEDKGVKAEVTKAVEAKLAKDAIFASNTSTLPISELAEASQNSERFIGIHFFSPVERMALVEIIKGKKTGGEAVAKAMDFVRQIKKTPIVVNDARYFYANRCIIPYINEGQRMLIEGVNPVVVENAAKRIGMPLGPFQLTDETAIDLGYRIMKATMADLGNAYVPTQAEPVIEFLYEEGRYGKKTKAGFYEYDDAGKRLGLWGGLNEKFPLAEEQPSYDEVKDRLALSQSLEAVRALEEGVLEDIREGDVGAVLGWGCMPWAGGPFGYLDIMGAKKAVARSEELAAKHGHVFEPPALLRELAAAGESFYGKFAAPKSDAA